MKRNDKVESSRNKKKGWRTDMKQSEIHLQRKENS